MFQRLVLIVVASCLWVSGCAKSPKGVYDGSVNVVSSGKLGETNGAVPPVALLVEMGDHHDYIVVMGMNWKGAGIVHAAGCRRCVSVDTRDVQ